MTLGIGETVTITATVAPDNATNKSVAWATSNADIATVANGVVTAVAKGEAKITATAGGKTAEVVITVLPVATDDENDDMGVFLIGWNTLRPYNEERGNYVSYQFKLVEEIKNLSEVKVSIFKDDTILATNTLKEPSKYGNEITGSFYTNDIKSTTSWNVEPITGNLGDEIFDRIELRIADADKIYTIVHTELRPISGNVKNLNKYSGYASIHTAIDAATAGDVIIVGNGEYNGALTINKAITLKSLNGRGVTTINGTITIIADDVTVDGFTVQAPKDYKTAPVIHMIDVDDVNILNNTVVADATAYSAIGTMTGPAKVTGTISGNIVTGMIMVGTDGELVVSDNKVTLTPASTEGICFYPVGSAAVITVTGNTVDAVTGGNVQIKVNEKPASVNGETEEIDMISAIQEDNNDATVNLSWVKTVGATGADYTAIQAAIVGATEGENIIIVYPGDYGTESIDITQKDGVNITLEAVGEVVLKNQIKISGEGRANDAETLTIKGFTFDFSDASVAVDIISAMPKNLDDTNNYAHNITIENNKFVGNLNVVAIRTNSTFGLNIVGCEGLGLHSLGQIQAQSKSFTVSNCTVTGGKSGVNYYGPSNAVITGLTVNGTEYGVRAGQGSGTVNEIATLTISDSNLSAYYPVWLRGDAPGTVIITDSELTCNEGGEEIKNDAVTTVLIDPPVYNKNLETYYITIQAAIDDATAGDTILVSPGEDVTIAATRGGYKVAGIVLNGVSLDGGGNTLTVTDANTTWDCAIFTTGGTIKNLTVGGAFRGIFTAGCTEDIIIDNVVIDNVCYTFNSDGSNLGHSVIIKNSTLNGWTSYTSGYKSVRFDNCILGKGTGASYDYAFARPYSDTEFIDCAFSEGYQLDANHADITLYNCTVGDVELTQENLVTLLGENAVKATVKKGL